MADATAKPPGPPPVRFERLLNAPNRNVVTTMSIIKAAVAATVAFQIAEQLGPARFAFLAPVVALFTVQGSVLGTLGQGVQRVLGNVVGVAVAAVWVQSVGAHWWSLLIALLVAIPIAGRLPLGNVGRAQVTLAVLLTVAAGPGVSGYGQWRVADTLIGGLVGIVVGVGLPERPRFDEVRAAQLTWADALASQLDAVAAELRLNRPPLSAEQRHDFMAGSRALYQTAVDGRAELTVASEGVHFNPWGRRERDTVDRFAERQRALVRVTLQIRTLALTIDQLYDRPGIVPRLTSPTLADLLDASAALLRARLAEADTSAASATLAQSVATSVTAVTQQTSDAYEVLDSVTLLGRIEQLRRDLVRPLSPELTDEDADDAHLPDLPEDPAPR